MSYWRLFFSVYLYNLMLFRQVKKSLLFTGYLLCAALCIFLILFVSQVSSIFFGVGQDSRETMNSASVSLLF
jgi:hypothetical protein